MRGYFIYFFTFIIFLGCKPEKKQESTVQPTETETVLEKIALAHGYENWNNVDKIAFTFNVDREDTHFERSWEWLPKTNDVMHISGQDTLAYNRKTMDSIAFKTNAGFINDRYWLLAPFNLMWDKENFTYEHSDAETAPISAAPMQKLTIVYEDEGGYTPGDAYDFYFGDDFLIKEWVFRKGNQTEASLVTTWENYNTLNGLVLVQDHKKAEGNFNIYLSEVKVK